jgi:hypothetical protein
MSVCSAKAIKAITIITIALSFALLQDETSDR